MEGSVCQIYRHKTSNYETPVMEPTNVVCRILGIRAIVVLVFHMAVGATLAYTAEQRRRFVDPFSKTTAGGG